MGFGELDFPNSGFGDLKFGEMKFGYLEGHPLSDNMRADFSDRCRVWWEWREHIALYQQQQQQQRNW